MKELYKISELPISSLLRNDLLIITSQSASRLGRVSNFFDNIIKPKNSPTIGWQVFSYTSDYPSSSVILRAERIGNLFKDTETIKLMEDNEGVLEAYNYNIEVRNTSSIDLTVTQNPGLLSYNVKADLKIIRARDGGLGIDILPQNNTILIGDLEDVLNRQADYRIRTLSSGLKIGNNNNVIIDDYTPYLPGLLLSELRYAIVESPSSSDSSEFKTININFSDIINKFNRQYIKSIHISCAGGLDGAVANIELKIGSPNNNRVFSRNVTNGGGQCISIFNITQNSCKVQTNVNKSSSKRVAGFGSVNNSSIRTTGINPYSSKTTAELARNQSRLNATLGTDVVILDSNNNPIDFDFTATLTVYRPSATSEAKNGELSKAVAFVELELYTERELPPTMQQAVRDTTLIYKGIYTLSSKLQTVQEVDIYSRNQKSFGNYPTGIYTLIYVQGAMSYWNNLPNWAWGGMQIWVRWLGQHLNFINDGPVQTTGPEIAGVILDGNSPEGFSYYSTPEAAVAGGLDSIPNSFYHFNESATNNSIYSIFPDDPYTDNRKYNNVAPTFALLYEEPKQIFELVSAVNQSAPQDALIVSLDKFGGLTLNNNREIKIQNELTFIDSTTEINVFVDGSESLNDTRSFIDTSINTYFKNIVKEFYYNDSALVDNMTRVIPTPTTGAQGNISEYYLRFLATVGRNITTKKVVNIYFGDEVAAHYTPGSNTNDLISLTPFMNPGPSYNADLQSLRDIMSIYGDDYFRLIVIQLQINYDGKFKDPNQPLGDFRSQNFNAQLNYIKNGLGVYGGINGLSDKKNFDYVGDIPKLQPPSYYAQIIKNVLVKLL